MGDQHASRTGSCHIEFSFAILVLRVAESFDLTFCNIFIKLLFLLLKQVRSGNLVSSIGFKTEVILDDVLEILKVWRRSKTFKARYFLHLII